MPRISTFRSRTEGSALLEFAIVLPLLVVFVVGIYDFSGAYNQKQKLEHAARTGAAIAAGQPTGDIESGNGNPESLQPVVDVVFNSLMADGVLPLANQGSCKPPVVPAAPVGLSWTYTISGCPDALTITINRGVFATGPTVATSVTVGFPYRWKSTNIIQFIVPGTSSSSDLQQTATVQNQM